MEIHLGLFKIPNTIVTYECVNTDYSQPWLGGISSHLQSGLEQGGDSGDMLSCMEAVRGKTDSSGKGTVIKRNIKGEFLYQ